VFNRYGKKRSQPYSSLIERTFNYLVDYDWNNYDFSKLNVDWCTKIPNYYLCARFEKIFRDLLIKQVREMYKGEQIHYIAMNDGIALFVHLSSENRLTRKPFESVCTKQECTVEYQGYTASLPANSCMVYKISAEWKHKHPDFNDFLFSNGIIADRPMEYTTKGKNRGKAIGKAKSIYMYDCDNGRFSEEEIKQKSTYKDVSRYKKHCNCKKYKVLV
jgi:hypothetical protein